MNHAARVSKYIFYPLVVLFFLLPFHAFLSTFLNSIISDGMFSANSYVIMGNPFIETQPYLPYYAVAKPVFFLINPSFYIVVWKEILTGIIIVLGLYSLIKKWREIQLDAVDYSIFSLFLLGGIAVLFREYHIFEALYGKEYIVTSGLKEILYGIKYDFMFLFFFLILKHLLFSNEQKKIILFTVLWTGSIVIIFGLILQFILPPDFLTCFGYYARIGYFNPLYPISFCQPMDLNQNCRMQSTFSGPNQLGAYLTIILPLFFSMSLEHWKKSTWKEKILDWVLWRKRNIMDNLKENKGKIVLLYLGFSALFFTFSRAALFGFAIGMFSYFFVTAENKKGIMYILVSSALCITLYFSLFSFFHLHEAILKTVEISRDASGTFHYIKAPLARHVYLMDFFLLFSKTIWIASFALFGMFLFLMPKKMHHVLVLLIIIGASAFLGYISHTEIIMEKILRFSSLQGHYERSMDGIKYIAQFPFGLGLGRAGPASSRMDVRGIGLLPESWYMQMGLEFGIAGIIVFVFILAGIGKHFLKNYYSAEKNTLDHCAGIALFITLIALSINALKLHTFEDASTSLTVFGLFGVFYNVSKARE